MDVCFTTSLLFGSLLGSSKSHFLSSYKELILSTVNTGNRTRATKTKSQLLISVRETTHLEEVRLLKLWCVSFCYHYYLPVVLIPEF